MANKDRDIFRDSNWRYLGYANEVGEAFRPLVPNYVVKASYAVATSYVAADTIDKSLKEYRRTEQIRRAAIAAGDVFIWQMLASVIIPGFTINRITTITRRVLKSARAHKALYKTIPTAAGLSVIPIIVHPIDQFVDYLMDNTFRKLF